MWRSGGDSPGMFPKLFLTGETSRGGERTLEGSGMVRV